MIITYLKLNTYKVEGAFSVPMFELYGKKFEGKYIIYKVEGLRHATVKLKGNVQTTFCC